MTVTELPTTTFPPPFLPTRARPPERHLHVALPHIPPALVDGAVVALLLTVVGFVGAGWVETGATSWYGTLRKTGWMGDAPAVFGVGNALVCATIALATWIVVRQRWARRGAVIGCVIACAAQLAVMLTMLRLLFVVQRIELALATGLLLVVSSTLAIAAFGRLSRTAGALMLPALLWATAVTTLAGGLVVLN
jgi:tryptophan-rich sensory protein